MAKVNRRRIRWQKQRDFLRQMLTQDLRFKMFLLLTLALIGILLLNFIPFALPFEGVLAVSEIGFTSTKPGQLLLKDIRGIQSITLSGQQTLSLPGDFSDNGKPSFIGNNLKIDLVEESSQWTLKPTDSKNSELTLSELHLQEGTQISDLKYEPRNRSLSFSLKPNSKASASDSGSLKIEPGSTPLQLTLERYRLPPNLKRQDNTESLTLTYENATEFVLSLTKPLDFTVQLSESDKQPFWRNIEVKDVRLDKLLQKADDFNDNVSESTILAGTMRMAESQLSLENSQFLLIDPPAIKTLNYLQIVYPDASKGLELQLSGQSIQVTEPFDGLKVAVSGETSLLQAGLNKKIRVARIEGSLLARYLTHDQIIALLSFCSALVVSLLAWLFDNFSKENSSS